ncbi:hypothetical protein J4I25_000901 [Salmonella enterica]|nr:hypothetical protein [Salmonella enterica]EDX4413546.1 hypothetical protein [Salmonella enterica subsp. houtenae serovar 44:z36,[z38]:-]EAY1905298.1 hypothetical protein [Salmonella enterica]EAY1918824.1 hypothetical protein [Salmonella enterica]EAY1964191.1 hypothetical protein [Salmonella enterica]
MKLLNYSMTFLFVFLSGCSVVDGVGKSFWTTAWGDLDKKNDAYTLQQINKYCTDNKLKSCDIYSKCFMRTYSTFPRDFYSYISWNSGCGDDNKNPSGRCLMDNVYNEMKKFEAKGNTVYMADAYILYAHNSCALVSGDKTYNIDKYNELIKEEIKCGKSKSLDNYKDSKCLNDNK